YLLAHTDGNAFLVGELWRHLVESGRVRRQGGRWTVAAPLVGIDTPEAVREVVGQRLDALPQATRAVLELAAVTGASFDVAVVARAAGVDIATVLDGLAPAVAAGFVEDAG